MKKQLIRLHLFSLILVPFLKVNAADAASNSSGSSKASSSIISFRKIQKLFRTKDRKKIKGLQKQGSTPRSELSTNTNDPLSNHHDNRHSHNNGETNPRNHDLAVDDHDTGPKASDFPSSDNPPLSQDNGSEISSKNHSDSEDDDNSLQSYNLTNPGEPTQLPLPDSDRQNAIIESGVITNIDSLESLDKGPPSIAVNDQANFPDENPLFTNDYNDHPSQHEVDIVMGAESTKIKTSLSPWTAAEIITIVGSGLITWGLTLFIGKQVEKKMKSKSVKQIK